MWQAIGLVFVSDLRTRFSVMGGFWSSGNNIIEAQ